MKRIIALSLCILTLFLCACQPTPEVEPVPNKGDDVMGEKIHTTPVPKTPDPNASEAPDVTEVPFVVPHIDVPEHWYEEIQFECGYKVIIDADIEYEDVAHPVFIIRDAQRFDGPTLKKLIDEFAHDPKWRPDDLTREELLQRLEELMKGEDPDVETDDVPQQSSEEKQEAIAEIIKKLQELDPETHWEDIKTPEDIPHGSAVISDGVREYHTNESGRSFTIKSFGNDVSGESELMILQAGDPLPVPSMEKEEAVRLAEEVLKDIGLEDHLKVASVTVERRNDGKGKILGVGWRVTCTLKMDGAKMIDPGIYDLQGQFLSHTDTGDEVIEFKPNTKMERLVMDFEDGVLVLASWIDPQEIVSVENPAVELLPFDTIKERIRKKIEYALASFDKDFKETGIVYKSIIDIDHIYLSYVKTAKANALYEYYYAPMWCFESNDRMLGMPCMHGVTFINAIDGTFVEFKMGF